MDQTAEVDFLRKHIQTIEKELLFWEEKRSLQVEKDGKAEFTVHPLLLGKHCST